LQGYSGPTDLHCESTDAEERFGKEKFGKQWEGRQTADDLSSLALVRDLNRDWDTFGTEDANERRAERRAPNYGPSSSALDRALRRQRMLAAVREDQSLLDLAAHLSNPALSLSDAKLVKLREARRIEKLITTAYLRDSVDVENIVAPTVSPKPSPMSVAASGTKKHYKKAPERSRVIAAMRALPVKELEQKFEKSMEAEYSASRDTCRKARYIVFALQAMKSGLANGTLMVKVLDQMTDGDLVKRYGDSRDRRPEDSCQEARGIVLAEHGVE
jgi:hypothetical protein